MSGACAGLRVIELGRGMPAALAGMILADHGADVVRLESPEGDPQLSEAGGRLWCRGKSRIKLDLYNPSQVAEARSLIAAADVLLLGLPPLEAERLGLTYPELASHNPALVFTSITGFGWDGPHRDRDIDENLMYAICGGTTMPLTGGLREGPIFIAPHMAAYGAACLAVQGALAALRERDGSGLGQHVDVGLYQALLVYRASSLWNPERQAEDFQLFPARLDPRGYRPLFNLNECADGRWLAMGAFTPALSYKALEVMGLMDLLGDERFAGLPNFFTDDEAREELCEILRAEFKKQPLQHWLDAMDAERVPSEPVLSVADFRDIGQLWANAHVVRVPDPVVGEMVQPGVLGEFSETPGEIRPAPPSALEAPAIGAVAERWARQSPVTGAGKMRPGGRGPLAGVRVLDLTVFLSGPMAGHLITDLGADVIKVEPPEGDDFRISAPSAFRHLHRDKQCVVLDLKTPEGQKGIEQLVRQSDVVLYNYRLGVEERLGLSYARLRDINPNIIVCRITAFGPHGERAHRGGYDGSITALSGMAVFQAGEGNPPVFITAADISTGLAGATAISLAIRARETKGVGQAIDVSMIGAMAYVAADALVDYAGISPGESLDKGQHGFTELRRLYRTADGWLMLSALPSQSEAIRAALGLAAGPALDAANLESAFARLSTERALALLEPAGIPCADPLVDAMTFLYETPEFSATATTIAVPHPVYGRLGQTGPAVRFSRTPVRVERQDAGLGEHNGLLLGST